jgi:diguanylate cyclase (GGDEF)-like protein
MTTLPERFPARPARTSVYNEATALAVILRWLILIAGAAWLYSSQGLVGAAAWILGGLAVYNGVLTLLRWAGLHPPLAYVYVFDLAAVTAILILHGSRTSDALFAFAALVIALALAYGWKGVVLSLTGYLAGEYAVMLAGTSATPSFWGTAVRIGSVSAGALIFGALVERHEALRLRLASATAAEPDSGVYDLQAFARALENLHKLATRGEWPYSVLVIDISQPGSPSGYKQAGIDERLLSRLAALVRSALRSTDLVGRVGADVFAVALPDTARPGAERVARRVEDELRRSAAQLEIAVGIASIEPTRQDSFDKCLHAAFTAVREAKAGGAQAGMR